LVYFTTNWYILQQIGIFYNKLVYFTTNWYILQQIGIFYNKLVYFTTNWYILQQTGIFYGLFGTFFTALVFCIKKNLATLVSRIKASVTRGICEKNRPKRRPTQFWQH
jgi:hypothetical protein